MLIGLGIDIIRTERIKAAYDRSGDAFIRRVFTADEWSHCNAKAHPWESLAARFAVKEAAFKALGRGWDECGGFPAVEVVSGANGKPSLIFHGRALQFAKELNVANSFVSITHDGDVAAAVVVLEA